MIIEGSVKEEADEGSVNEEEGSVKEEANDKLTARNPEIFNMLIFFTN